MKKTRKTLLTAAALAAAVNLSACNTNGSSDTSDPSSQQSVTAQSETDYDPSKDEPQDIYGPPTDLNIDPYVPSSDRIPVIYGPPEMSD